MSSSNFDHYTPLKYPRLGALFFSFAWGIIGLGIAINALVKSNQAKDAVTNQLPDGVSVDINTNDVFRTGIIIAVTCAIIALLSFLYILILLLSKSHKRPSSSTLMLQWASLGFFALWLFTVQTPFTVFYSRRSAQVKAFIGGVEASPQLLAQTERLLGLDPAYKSQFYLKLLAILPWFTFLFTVIAAAVSFAAYRRAKGYDSKGREKN